MPMYKMETFTAEHILNEEIPAWNRYVYICNMYIVCTVTEVNLCCTSVKTFWGLLCGTGSLMAYLHSMALGTPLATW